MAAGARRRRAADFHVVLLAGGSGTRFWPLSRGRRPKQFLPLGGKGPLLVETWKRVRELVPPTRLWIVAPKALAEDIRRTLPGLRDDRLVLEPSPRDTAPAVGLACATVARRAPQAVVGIFPTDHVVADVEAFVSAVEVAAEAARDGGLVCLGVTPDRPATGFGYLKCRSRPSPAESVAVERFVEKPDASRAARYVRSGRYVWNAGMFVWRVDRFLDELQRTAPGIAGAVRRCAEGRRDAWQRATRLSVDYAVMEKARGVRVVALEAGWNDVGSWEAAAALAGPARSRDRILVDSENTVVFSRGRMVAVVDVPGVVVVDTEDALLVVSRSGSERVRNVVEELRRRGRRDLL